MLSRDRKGPEATENGGLMHAIERRKRIDHNRRQLFGLAAALVARVFPCGPMQAQTPQNVVSFGANRPFGQSTQVNAGL